MIKSLFKRAKQGFSARRGLSIQRQAIALFAVALPLLLLTSCGPKAPVLPDTIHKPSVVAPIDHSKSFPERAKQEILNVIKNGERPALLLTGPDIDAARKIKEKISGDELTYESSLAAARSLVENALIPDAKGLSKEKMITSLNNPVLISCFLESNSPYYSTTTEQLGVLVLNELKGHDQNNLSEYIREIGKGNIMFRGVFPNSKKLFNDAMRGVGVLLHELGHVDDKNVQKKNKKFWREITWEEDGSCSYNLINIFKGYVSWLATNETMETYNYELVADSSISKRFQALPELQKLFPAMLHVRALRALRFGGGAASNANHFEFAKELQWKDDNGNSYPYVAPENIEPAAAVVKKIFDNCLKKDGFENLSDEDSWVGHFVRYYNQGVFDNIHEHGPDGDEAQANLNKDVRATADAAIISLRKICREKPQIIKSEGIDPKELFPNQEHMQKQLSRPVGQLGPQTKSNLKV